MPPPHCLIIRQRLPLVGNFSTFNLRFSTHIVVYRTSRYVYIYNLMSLVVTRTELTHCQSVLDIWTRSFYLSSLFPPVDFSIPRCIFLFCFLLAERAINMFARMYNWNTRRYEPDKISVLVVLSRKKLHSFHLCCDGQSAAYLRIGDAHNASTSLQLDWNPRNVFRFIEYHLPHTYLHRCSIPLQSIYGEVEKKHASLSI